MERLKPFREVAPNAGWEKWVKKLKLYHKNIPSSLMPQVLQAYHASISLSAHGFYKMPHLGIDWESGTGKPSLYETYGAGCSEVEIDVLTGRAQVSSLK